ncbi:CDGSH iron-sulfur domain-containing protein [Streptomyces sp. 205]|uniref:CDGSH iron-sulfur domain-containing protein n=1 Tax=Streptomyces coffeae TaxID=621382 RepID=A0ABS1NJQ9_9ACTN|nr:CDGSH iron-sulfur domain-containing protein [Streptomyces coffeae]
MANASERPRRITIDPDGPLVIEGPVEVVDENGTVLSRRFAAAICTCHRSGIYPWCDTSHRAGTPPRGENRRTRSCAERKEESG